MAETAEHFMQFKNIHLSIGLQAFYNYTDRMKLKACLSISSESGINGTTTQRLGRVVFNPFRKVTDLNYVARYLPFLSLSLILIKRQHFYTVLAFLRDKSQLNCRKILTVDN